MRDAHDIQSHSTLNAQLPRQPLVPCIFMHMQHAVLRALAVRASGEVVVKKEAQTAEISKIFKWYKQDFGPQEQLLQWLPQYLSGSSKTELQDLLSTVGAKHIRLTYRHYDWSLNSQD